MLWLWLFVNEVLLLLLSIPVLVEAPCIACLSAY